jgi:hypothetical protein
VAVITDLLFEKAWIHDKAAGLRGGLDHPGTEIRRILRVAGHSCVALVALPACLAAEQKFNEPAAQGGLRRSLAHRRCADAGPRNSTLAGEAAERIGESRAAREHR